MEETIGDHTSRDIILLVILDIAITRNHKNGNHNLWSQQTCHQNQTPLSLSQSSTFTYCQPSWISVIIKNHKNGYYNSGNQHRNLQPKPNPTKFGSSFNFHIRLAILDFHHYQKSQNGNYNRGNQHRDMQPKPNPTKFGYNLQLSHDVSHLEFQPLSKITKMAIITQGVNIETCNPNQTPLSLGQSSTFK